MKLRLILISIVAPVFLHATSYWSPESELRNLKIDEILYAETTEKKFTAELIAQAKKQGYDIEIINKGKPADFSKFKSATVVKNLNCLFHLEKVLRGGSNDLFIEKLTSRKHLRVIIYESIQIKSIRMVCVRPGSSDESKDYDHHITLKDFTAGKEIPNTASVFYNIDADTMQVAAHLNFLFALDAEIKKEFKDSGEYGLISKIETKRGNIYFAIGENTGGFLNLSLSKDAQHYLPAFADRIIRLLPSNYELTFRDYFRYHKFNLQGVTVQQVDLLR